MGDIKVERREGICLKLYRMSEIWFFDGWFSVLSGGLYFVFF